MYNIKLKTRVKQYLIGANIILLAICIALAVIWLAFARPEQIVNAIELEQYYAYDLQQLPDNSPKVEADYISNLKLVSDDHLISDDYIEEIDLVEQALAAIDNDAPQLVVLDDSQDLIEQTDKLLQQTGQLLASHKIDKNSIPQRKKLYKGKPKIGIIITNLGLNRRSTELALTLPKQCALGFLPYTKSLRPLLHRAQGDGHEIYLYLPLETNHAFSNPGKHTLMTSFAPEDNALRLDEILNSHTRYNGIYSSYKEIFTDNAQSLEMLLSHFDDKNLTFIWGKGAIDFTPRNIKARHNILPAHVIIDQNPDKESINMQLKKLTDIASNNGFALGYAQNSILTIKMIREWISNLKNKGMVIAPVSEILKRHNS